MPGEKKMKAPKCPRGQNNLVMQPYQHYLAEYQRMHPESIAQRLELPYDLNRHQFQIRFMEKNYRISHPDFEIQCMDKNGKREVLCEDIHAKILLLRYLTEGDHAEASGNLLSYRDLPWGNVYYRQFYGRCIGRLARMFGNHQDEFKILMENMEGVLHRYGDISYEFEFLEDLRLCFVLWAGDEEFPPSAQILFSDNFPSAFAAEDAAYIGDVILDYLKSECLLVH